jgi:hypothetical protein
MVCVAAANEKGVACHGGKWKGEEERRESACARDSETDKRLKFEWALLQQAEGGFLYMQ